MIFKHSLPTKSVAIILIAIIIFIIGVGMAKIYIKLDLMGETVEGNLNSKSANLTTNNVSKATTEPTEPNDGFNGICIGKYHIGQAGGLQSFADGYNGIMFGATDSSGELATDLVFTIAGINITNITFYFDETAEQWATEAYIDGEKRVSDDYIWAFAWETPVTAKTITFTKWHRPNYNACITHMAIELDNLILDEKWIEEFDSISQSVADQTQPQYGVIANTGDVLFNDVNGELKDYAEDGILKNSNYPLRIYVNNKQVQYHISADTNYDTDAMQLKIELSNGLSVFDNYNFDGIKARRNNYNIIGVVKYITAYDLLAKVMGYGQDENGKEIFGTDITSKYPEYEAMLDGFTYLYDNGAYFFITIAGYLKSIRLNYVYLEKSNIREAIDKVCEIAQLNLIEKDDGSLKFISARPLFTKNGLIAGIEYKDTLAVIPLSAQNSAFVPSIISKNRYNKVFIKSNQTTESIGEFTRLDYIGYEKNESTGLFQNKIGNNAFGNTTLTQFVDSDMTHYFTEFTKEIEIPDLALTDYYYDKTGNQSMQESLLYYFLTHSYINYDYTTGSGTASGTEGSETITLNTPLDYSLNNVMFVETPTDTRFEHIALVDNKSAFDALHTKKNSSNYDIVIRNLIGIDKSLSTENKLVIHFRLQYKYKLVVGGVNHFFLVKSGNVVLQNNFLNLKSSTITKTNEEDTSGTINIFNFNENSLIQNDTRVYRGVGYQYIYDVISNNILKDYENGIITASLSVNCQNIYDFDGNLIKNWQNGEVLQVGDVVRVDKDNLGNSASRYKDGSPRYFRITSRTFRYDGVPIIDLKLMEVRAIEDIA